MELGITKEVDKAMNTLDIYRENKCESENEEITHPVMHPAVDIPTKNE